MLGRPDGKMRSFLSSKRIQDIRLTSNISEQVQQGTSDFQTLMQANDPRH